jgi:hypothetical protein
MPDVEVLNGGLEPENGRLREPLAALTMPHLRIYGYLDGLVPRKVVPLLDSLWPDSESQIAKAAHARLSLIRRILFSAHCVKSTFRLIIFYPAWKVTHRNHTPDVVAVVLPTMIKTTILWRVRL